MTTTVPPADTADVGTGACPAGRCCRPSPA